MPAYDAIWKVLMLIIFDSDAAGMIFPVTSEIANANMTSALFGVLDRPGWIIGFYAVSWLDPSAVSTYMLQNYLTKLSLYN
jgi:hypothetical protein